MNSVKDFDVIVIGGGIVGSVAACLLAHHYQRVALVSNTQPISWQPEQPFALRVSAINLASIRLLSKIGVWSQVEALRCHPYHDMQVWEQDNAAKISFHASDTSHATLGAIVENNVLLHSLQNAIDDTQVTQINNNALQSMTEISGTSMLLELEKGDRLSAQLIVGADGQNSKVRDCMGIGVSRIHYRQAGLVATVNTQQETRHTAWQCFTRQGPLALLPLGANQGSIVWSLPEADCQHFINLDEAEFNQQLASAFEGKFGRIELSSPRKSFPLSGAQADHYVDHRVALVGDAAHCIHPLAGLGLNLGLADIAQLLELLQHSQRPLGSARVLRQYERARKSEAVLMQRSLEWLDALFRSDHTLLKELRGKGVSATDNILPLKQFFMSHALGVPV